MGLRVLLTNYYMKGLGGAQLYIRDLALELQRQGHEPLLYTTIAGPLCEELQAAGIPVTTKLRGQKLRPDIIHGNGRLETLIALLHYPQTPAIFVAHSHMTWLTRLPDHPRLRRCLGVSEICVAWLRLGGVPEHKLGLLFNFVDLQRFLPRTPLPVQPSRALIFSNYANEQTHLPAVRAACQQAGLPLDVIGAGVGNLVERPEERLGDYDLIFAKGKAAMEAMAVGAAVILCDFSGVGPLVTTTNFDQLRPLNFGFQALENPLQSEYVLPEILRFNAADATQVQARLRTCASLESAVSHTVAIYREVIAEQQRAPVPQPGRGRLADAITRIRYQLLCKLVIVWNLLSTEQRNAITNLLGGESFRLAAKRLLLGK